VRSHRAVQLACVAETTFLDYARPVDGFGLKSGEMATLTRMAALPQPIDASLPERELMPEDSFTLSTNSIGVKELGRAVPYTSLSDDLSRYDLENPIQEALRDRMLSLRRRAWGARAHDADAGARGLVVGRVAAPVIPAAWLFCVDCRSMWTTDSDRGDVLTCPYGCHDTSVMALASGGTGTFGGNDGTAVGGAALEAARDAEPRHHAHVQSYSSLS
jgi:hypothetical protein